MPEAGIEETETPTQYQPMDDMPRDIIELNKDIYQPSTKYSTRNESVQKDMVLANLGPFEIAMIRMELDLIEVLNMSHKRHPERFAKLQSTINDEYSNIANIVTASRGRGGFTARLIKSSFVEQKQTMGYIEGREKQKGIVNKLTRGIL